MSTSLITCPLAYYGFRSTFIQGGRKEMEVECGWLVSILICFCLKDVGGENESEAMRST
jgi:hypothetical protein